MTNLQLERIAHKLLNSKSLIGGDEPKYLPKIFVVNGKCYWFLNVARRAAFGTNHPIEVMTIEQAWEIWTHLHRDTLNKECVAWEFDQTGETFHGNLFYNNRKSQACMVSNKIIPIEYDYE